MRRKRSFSMTVAEKFQKLLFLLFFRTCSDVFTSFEILWRKINFYDQFCFCWNERSTSSIKRDIACQSLRKLMILRSNLRNLPAVLCPISTRVPRIAVLVVFACTRLSFFLSRGISEITKWMKLGIDWHWTGGSVSLCLHARFVLPAQHSRYQNDIDKTLVWRGLNLIIRWWGLDWHLALYRGPGIGLTSPRAGDQIDIAAGRGTGYR